MEQIVKDGRLYILDLGDLTFDKMLILKDYGLATIDNPNPPHELTTASVRAFYLDSPKAKILFETGCNPNWRQTWERHAKGAFMTRERFLKEALDEINVSLDDIDYVVMGHLHLDHTGGLPLFAGRKAKIIAQEEELKKALRDIYCKEGAYRKSDIALDGLNWTTVDGDHYFMQGIEFISLPGQSAGLMGMKMTLKNSGSIIFPSDASDTPDNYGPPIRMPGSLWDSVAYRKSIERLRQIVNKKNAQIFYTHWINQPLKKPPEYYD